MKTRKKILYWVATVWLALGMTATGLGQLFGMESGVGGVVMMNQLGYPLYLLSLLGSLKLIGVAILLLPKLRLAKEWTYAGFVFLMLGAMFSHLASGEALNSIFPALLLLVLALVSWRLRPDSRKLQCIVF